LLAALEQQPQPNARELEQKLAASLVSLAQRQSAVVDETTVWGKESPGEVLNAAVRELAVRQADLAEETKELAQGMPESSGYVLALELAARPMNQASRRLSGRQVDDETVRIERRALDFLKDLIASLSETSESATTPQQPEADSPMPPDDGSPAARQPTLAELKLLRLVQLEILQRTAELEESKVEQPDWSADQRQELEDLSGRQRRLAELLEAWSTSPVQAPPAAATNPQPDSSSLQRHVPQWQPRNEWVFVAWTQTSEAADQPPSQNTPRPPANPLDRSLLDDVPPARPAKKPPVPAGEDIGQPSHDGSPIAELGRQMRKIESLLRGGDTSSPT
jgi:hypothetical protein